MQNYPACKELNKISSLGRFSHLSHSFFSIYPWEMGQRLYMTEVIVDRAVKPQLKQVPLNILSSRLR